MFTLIVDCPVVDSNSTNSCLSSENIAACEALKGGGCNELFYHDQVCPYIFGCVDDYEMTTGNFTCPSPRDECVTGRNFETCLGLQESGCEGIGIAKSCPYQFDCVDGAADLASPFTIAAECPAVDLTCMNEENFAACQELKDRGCNEVFYHDQICSYEFDCVDDYESTSGNCPSPRDACVTGVNFAECRALEGEGCQNVARLESCPYQFACSDGSILEPPETSTVNQIYVLDARGNVGQLPIVGNVTLGKPNEGTAVVLTLRLVCSCCR
jgi:hypothetical protein